MACMCGQDYLCAITDALLAEAGGVSLDALHWDVDAICRCYGAVVPLADRLGIDVPRPGLAGFSYAHVSTLGAEVVFAPGSEPAVRPIIRSPSDIDHLREPRDYVASGIVPRRLRVLDELIDREPNARRSIGHLYEGPVTTATLLMGPEFFLLPHLDPKRGHRLLSFCVTSAVNYATAIRERLGIPLHNGPVSLPDDFGGIFAPDVFREFTAAYWDEMYRKLDATERRLHSELLRPEHLPVLAELGIAEFDPSADQYVTPELLRERCPVPFTGRIQTWTIRDNPPEQLQELYRQIADCSPTRISFYMTALEEEEKIRALLDVARDLAR